MLPLTLLKVAQGYHMLVELKNGETYNGNLVAVDSWMNIHLRDVICTSRDGDKFWRMQEVYIRGTTIKYIRIPDEVLEMVKEDSQIVSGPKKPRMGGRDAPRTRGSGRGNTGLRGAPSGRGGRGGRGGYMSRGRGRATNS